MLRMAALYIPRQLYKKENMIKNAQIFREGVSYYFVDGNRCGFAGRCYDHDFLRFSTDFRRKKWRFSQKQAL
jgi:hypothetical protein